MSDTLFHEIEILRQQIDNISSRARILETENRALHLALNNHRWFSVQTDGYPVEGGTFVVRRPGSLGLRALNFPTDCVESRFIAAGVTDWFRVPPLDL